MNLQEAIAVFLLKALGRLSLKNLYRLAKVIYVLLLPFPLKFKRTIRINIGRCLPELSQQDLKKLVKINTFQTILRMLEMPFFWFAPKDKIARLIWETKNEAEFKAVFQQGRGVIVLVPHLGAWEGVNYYMGLHYSAVSLYKPRKARYQELLLKIVRERFGVEMFPTNLSGIKSLFQALQEGKCAGILSDHDPGDNGGIFVPFFGIAANTSTLIAKLEYKSQAPIFFVVAERLPKGQGFRLHFIPANKELGSKNLTQATQALNIQTAAIIKKNPEQYEWSYKRFRRTRWGKVWFYETDVRAKQMPGNAVGLIGGIATGKTTAANFFKTVQIEVIDTDMIARELTAKGSPILKKIIEHFGDDILTEAAELDRTRLRSLIFQNPQERAWLEALLHPLIRKQVELKVVTSKTPYCVVAIPLLKRREDYPFLQKIIYIATKPEDQIKRLMARDQITRDAAAQIINAQPTDAEFRKIADIVIENNGTEAELEQQLELVHEQKLVGLR